MKEFPFNIKWCWIKSMPDGFVPLSVAARIAKKFVTIGGYDCENPDPDGPQLSGEYSKIRMFRSDVCYLFTLMRGHQPSGYVLISGQRKYQPILDYCDTGESPIGYMERFLRYYFEIRHIPILSIDYLYFGPFDYVAEIYLRDGSTRFARLPNLRFVEEWDSLSFECPVAEQNDEFVLGQWEAFLDERVELPSAGAECSRMFWWRFVPYNQTCRSQGIKTTKRSSENYCSPSCIAGCSPVAWMVLASGFRGRDPNRFPLFADAPDWSKPWESSYGGPPRPGSEIVNNRLWELHDFLHTDCAGGTRSSRVHKGHRIFSTYNLNWKWGHFNNLSYEQSKEINKGGLAYLCSAESNWSGTGADRHSFVVRGYNDNTGHVYVSLGWGASFPDKWVPYSFLLDTSAIYVSDFRPNRSDKKNIEANAPCADYSSFLQG